MVLSLRSLTCFGFATPMGLAVKQHFGLVPAHAHDIILIGYSDLQVTSIIYCRCFSWSNTKNLPFLQSILVDQGLPWHNSHKLLESKDLVYGATRNYLLYYLDILCFRAGKWTRHTYSKIKNKRLIQ